MMDPREKELREAVRSADIALAAAREELWDYRCSRLPYSIGDIVSFSAKGKAEEGKVVGVTEWCNELRPQIIQKKKNGDWSTRLFPAWRIDDNSVQKLKTVQ